jgi:hypothetical protein
MEAEKSKMFLPPFFCPIRVLTQRAGTEYVGIQVAGWRNADVCGGHGMEPTHR